MGKAELGIDSFSYYYKLTSKQKSKILEHLKAKKKFRIERDDYESDTHIYFSSYFKDDGIKIWIERIKGNPWGMLIVVHPLLVLGDPDRSALYQLREKSDYNRLVKRVDRFLKTVDVPCSIYDMKLYRVDVTANLLFEDEAYVMEYLRILKKSCLLPRFQLDWFRENEHKAKDCKAAEEYRKDPSMVHKAATACRYVVRPVQGCRAHGRDSQVSEKQGTDAVSFTKSQR